MKKAGMLALNEWAQNKPIGLTVVAEQSALGTEELYKWLKSIKVEELMGDDIDVPPLKEWLSLYRRHRHLEEVLIEIFRSLGGIGEYWANLVESIFELRRYIRKIGWENFKRECEQITPDEYSGILREGQRQAEKLQRLHSEDIQCDIEGKINEDFDQRLREVVKKGEMLFFLKVWMPCFFQYGEFPGRLLRKPRLGDIDVLEKILRVDTSVIGDPRICEHFYRASWKRSKVDFSTMAKALQKGPKRKSYAAESKIYSCRLYVVGVSNHGQKIE